MNAFLSEYKISVDDVSGLIALLTSHELPVGSIVDILGNQTVIKHTQPIIIRYFIKTNKLHLYYDGYRIYRTHLHCLDRLHLKPLVSKILRCAGVRDFSYFLKCFDAAKLNSDLHFVDGSILTSHEFTYRLWLNHFNDKVELSQYLK